MDRFVHENAFFMSIKTWCFLFEILLNEKVYFYNFLLKCLLLLMENRMFFVCIFSNEYTTLKGIIKRKVATMVYFKFFSSRTF